MRPIAAPKHDRTSRILFLSATILLGLLQSGCFRDPLARKQKFLSQGDQAFGKGDFASAAISYGRAIQIDPRFAEAHFKLAETRMKMNNWAAAYQELQRTIELEPLNSRAQVGLGQMELRGGRTQQAKDRALLVLRASPRDPDAQMLLASVDLALHDPDRAVREAQQAVAFAPENPAVLINLGQIQYRAGQSSEAESSFIKAQTLDPKGVVSYLDLGSLYQEQKRSTLAEKQFEAAIAVEPRDHAPRAALARLYFAENQPAQAEKILSEAKAQLPNDPVAYRMLGDSFLARGEVTRALGEFASLARDHPGDFATQRSYAGLLMLSNRLEEASGTIDALLQKSPQDPETLIQKGQLLLRQAKAREAVALLQAALKTAPQIAAGHYFLGLGYSETGSAYQAEGEWREALRLNPALSEAWIALCRSVAERSDWQGLLDLSSQWKNSSPKSTEAALYHATALIKKGDTAAAEAELLHLQKENPRNPVVLATLGELRLAEKRVADAGSLFGQSLALDPNSLEASYGMATVYVQKNKLPEALKFVSQQIARTPGNLPLYSLQARLFLEAKDPVRAEASLTHMLAIDDKNVNGLLSLAQIQSSQGETDQAIASYERAIALEPNDARAEAALGMIYERQGNWQMAETAYQKALSLAPDNPLVSNNLASLLLEHDGSPNVALTLAQTARKGLPHLINTADTLGWAYYHSGAYSLAAPLLQEAVEKVPENQAYRYHLGLTYQKLGQSQAAQSELLKAIALAPGSSGAELARRALRANPSR